MVVQTESILKVILVLATSVIDCEGSFLRLMRPKTHRLLEERARRSTIRTRLLAEAVFTSVLVHSATSPFIE